MPMKPFRLSGQEKGGLAVAAAGATALALAAAFGATEGFWVPYADGSRLMGWLALFSGSAWLALVAARNRTSCFDLHRRLDVEKLGVTLAAIALAIFVALVLVIPHLPATAESNLPGDPNAQARILGTERNFRLFVTTALALAGTALSAYPILRFLRK